MNSEVSSSALSNNLYHQLLEKNLAGYWDWNIASNTQYLSPRFKTMLGYEPFELDNHPDTWKKLIYEEDLDRAFNAFAKHVETKGEYPYDLLVRYHHKSGKCVFIQCTGFVTSWDKKGAPMRMIGTHVDVSDSVELQKETEKSVERFESLIEESDLGIWEWELHRNSHWMTGSLFQSFKAEQQKTTNKLEEFIRLRVGSDCQERISASIQKCKDESSPFTTVVKIKTRTGEFLWHEVKGKLVTEESRKVLILTFNECHENMELRREAEFNAFLFSEAGRMTGVGGWYVNFENDTLYWSDQVKKIHGVPDDYVPNLEIGINFYHPDDRAMVSNSITQAVVSKAGFEFEARLVRVDGKTVWVHSIGTVVRNANDDVIGIRGVFQDIQAFKDREHKLEQSSTLLKSQNLRLLNFTHIVSHNLRAHSSNFEMIMDVMNSETVSGEIAEQRDMLTAVSQSLSETIQDLNTIVDIQSNESLVVEPLNLKPVIERNRDLLQAELTRVQSIIQIEIDSDLVVLANKSYLNSVIQNLLTNAIKYRKLNEQLHLKVTATIEKDTIEIHIEDNGIGIDLDLHGTKMFGLYKRFTNRENSKGVGLFMTKGQVEAMGGEIRVESTPGSGSKFHIKLQKG